MSRRRRRRSVELPMPALGHVVLPHTSKIKPYTARGHCVRSCKDLCETQLSRCEIQIGLCAAIVVLQLADLRGTAKVFHILLFSVPLEHVCPFRAPRHVRCSAIRTVKVVGINTARSVRSALSAAFIPTTLQYGSRNTERGAERGTDGHVPTERKITVQYKPKGVR